MSENLSEATHAHIIELLLEHRRDTIKRLQDGEQRMGGIEKAVQENTELTREIRDAVNAGKVLTRVLKWAASIAAAVATIWWAVRAFMGGPHP